MSRIAVPPETSTMIALDAMAPMRRLTTFAADVLELADARADLELRHLLDQLHADLISLRPDDD